MITNRLRITSRERPGCLVCGSKDIPFTVTFADMDNPPSTRELLQGRGAVWNQRGFSCREHIAQVTFIILQRAGLAPKEAANESNDDPGIQKVPT